MGELIAGEFSNQGVCFPNITAVPLAATYVSLTDYSGSSCSGSPQSTWLYPVNQVRSPSNASCSTLLACAVHGKSVFHVRQRIRDDCELQQLRDQHGLHNDLGDGAVWCLLARLLEL